MLLGPALRISWTCIQQDQVPSQIRSRVGANNSPLRRFRQQAQRLSFPLKQCRACAKAHLITVNVHTAYSIFFTFAASKAVFHVRFSDLRQCTLMVTRDDAKDTKRHAT